MENLISMRDLSKDEILKLIDTAARIENGELEPDLSGKVMAALFYEPSTRTQLSFETAMKRLRGEVISMIGTKGTSVEKGESLADTVKVVSQYSDIIVMRHTLEGAARYVAKHIDIPVVNAGDGANQHPTQSLLDIYSIHKTQGSLDGLKIAMVGDLKYGRTVHSLAFAMSHFNPEFYFVAPSFLQMPDHINTELANMDIPFHLDDKIENVIDKVDILYVTRIQGERFSDPEEYEKAKGAYVVRKNLLNNAKDNLKVLHPLPRVNEIHTEVDDLKHAYYFDQARNGVYMRQAILSRLLGAVK